MMKCDKFFEPSRYLLNSLCERIVILENYRLQGDYVHQTWMRGRMSEKRTGEGLLQSDGEVM